MSLNLDFKKILSFLLFLVPISFIIGAAVVEVVFILYLFFFFMQLIEKN